MMTVMFSAVHVVLETIVFSFAISIDKQGMWFERFVVSY
jgi:hypothetical protein